MNVEIKATKSNKEKGEKKQYGMIPRMRTLRIGEIIFPTATTLNRANTERMKRILNRSKYTRIFQDTNKELLQIIKDLNPRLTQKEIKELLTEYEEFEQPKEMAIALEEEAKNINRLIQIKNEDIRTKTQELKDIKKDVQDLQAEKKRLLARAEKYKKIKYDRK